MVSSSSRTPTSPHQWRRPYSTPRPVADSRPIDPPTSIDLPVTTPFTLWRNPGGEMLA